MTTEGTGRVSRATLVSELWATARCAPRRWFASFVIGQVVPICEVSLIFTIYAILSEPKQAQVVSQAQQMFGQDAFLVRWIEDQVLEAGLVVSLVLLGLFVALRYANDLNLMRLGERMQVRDAQRIVGRFLDSSIGVARNIPKDRITSSLIQDCGVMADMMRRVLAIVAAVWSLGLFLSGAILLSWKVLVLAIALYALPLWLARRTFEMHQRIGETKLRSNEESIGWFTDLIRGFARLKFDALETPLTQPVPFGPWSSFRMETHKAPHAGALSVDYGRTGVVRAGCHPVPRLVNH
jgi:hypothetical protein